MMKTTALATLLTANPQVQLILLTNAMGLGFPSAEQVRYGVTKMGEITGGGLLSLCRSPQV